MSMKARFLQHECVLVEDKASIDRLQRSGLGARQLNPIIMSAEAVTGESADSVQTSPLLLLDEEAFYLAQKGHLEVHTSTTGETATLDALWGAFVARNANFPVKYKVFAYYKDKSYVVRTGINFGVDYCAYHTLPSLCHSEMCITVVDATLSGRQASSTAANTMPSQQDRLTWRHVTTLTRVVPDVNKICVICYVLPVSDAPSRAVQETAPVVDANTHADGDVVMSEDVVADMQVDSAGGADSVISSDSGASGGGGHTTVVAPAPTVSPYLSTLFPTHPKTTNNTTNTTNTTTTTTTTIDYTSHTCLEALCVRPVTALVRRLPALHETHQTVNAIQKAYHAASTAQKKRELKALTAKGKHNNNKNIKNNYNNNKNVGGGDKKKYKDHKPHNRVSATAGIATPSNTNTDPNSAPADSALNNTNTTDPSASTTNINTTTNTTDPTIPNTEAALSGRQKRLAKYQLKQQALQTLPHTLPALPVSKQMKERRDHRENRTKVMSNKNQSLLNMMQEGGGEGSGSSNGTRESQAGSNSKDSHINVKRRHSGSAVNTNADIGTVNSGGGATGSTTGGTGSAFSYLSSLLYPINTAPTANNTTTAGPSTHSNSKTPITTDAYSGSTGSGGGGEVEGPHKRSRTQYAHSAGTTSTGTSNTTEVEVEAEKSGGGYFSRATSHCIVS